MNTIEIYDLIVTADGKLPSRNCNFESFKKKAAHKPELVEFIASKEGTMTPRDFVHLCRLNLTTTGTCSCGAPCMFVHHSATRLSKYCSVACSRLDKKRIQEGVRKRDSDPNAKVSSNQKRRQTMLEKYGVEYNSQRAEVKPALGRNAMTTENRSRVESKEWVYEQYVTLGKTHDVIAKEFKMDKTTITHALRQHNIKARHGYSISYGQREVASFIESMGFAVVLNKRGVLPDNKEIDVYVENANFAIEYDGLYYHGLSIGHTSTAARYHQWKVTECHKKGVDLIRVTEEEWRGKKELIKSMIRHRLGVSVNRLNARKLEVRNVSSKESRAFLEASHISGWAGAKIHLGLYDGEKLVQICSFSSPRFSSDADWEIIRFATVQNTIVRGGFQKLLKWFRSNHRGSIMTYADRRISRGNVYEKAGFELIGLTDPGYVWTDGNVTLSRYQTQKSKLSALLGKKFDPAMSEEKNMFNNGYKIYYNCGNLKYVLK